MNQDLKIVVTLCSTVVVILSMLVARDITNSVLSHQVEMAKIEAVCVAD